MQVALGIPMMSTPLPSIYRDCRRLLLCTEPMVMRFASYLKRIVGSSQLEVSDLYIEEFE